jgi:hypothetical protein
MAEERKLELPLELDKRGNIQLRATRALTLNYTIPVKKIDKFWVGISEGKLFTTKCKKCGEVFFPPTGDCTKCMVSDVEWIELSGDAELESFNEIFVKPASFQQYPNYICAVGRLKEGPRALAWLTGIERNDVKVGMKLKLRPKCEEEEKRLTYEFVPGG